MHSRMRPRYTLAYLAHATALATVRPIYYDFPMLADAYSGAYSSMLQYMMGDSILVSPVVAPLGTSGASPAADIWFPPGTAWVPAFANSPSPTARNATGWSSVAAQLAEVPVYVCAGAILPMLPYATAISHGSASRAFDPLEWWVYPSATATQGSAWVYEDDGLSNDYLSGPQVNLSIAYRTDSASNCTLFTLDADGSYAGAPDNGDRRMLVRLVAASNATGTGSQPTVWSDGGYHAYAGTCSNATVAAPGTWCTGDASVDRNAIASFVSIALRRGYASHAMEVCGVAVDTSVVF
jgi:hypothetical protein